ncbi:DEAD/DEAH box helicase [Psychrobacillus lasiicapitis]|uniref:Helicase SNF n=2 Tax=Psychrobacillus lasiicapitis TaxID=1636719 RepID=A0A544T6U9_9BACI|nr:DEAD/DEAH box helicase [Psychrobacillus lasiicapitis]TQR13172.1 helicase SNF [Psychrobacillus lasiicapitis]GGA33875.1 helicase SNF [Psychrobacillus lasiicapitis]
MNFSMNETKIKKLCGVTAFKKGKAYFQAEKVNLHPAKKESTVINANVKVGDGFDVMVKAAPGGKIVANCTCPQISFVQTYCQHIAAVLLSIEEKQQAEDHLAAQMLELFENKSSAPTGKQLHFDKRQTLHVEFTYRPVYQTEGEYTFGIQLSIGSRKLHPVSHIAKFLSAMESREPFEYAPGLIYTPELFSFPRETDEVLQFLMKSQRIKSKAALQEGLLLISASDWEQLLPLLEKAPAVRVMHGGQIFDGVHIGKDLSLSFEFEEGHTTGYQLNVKGLEQITVLKAYGYALSEGILYKLLADECNRLVELKAMLDKSGTHQLVISDEQIDHFMEKVIPGLMKLGQVIIAESISKRLGETPLRIKMFLDRVKHRLLVGLEFHYGHLVINPCEETEETFSHYPGIRRQRNKELQIMELLEENSFTQTEGGFFLYDEEAEYHFLYHILGNMEKWVQVYASTAVKMRVQRGYIGPRIRVEVKERTDWLEFKFDLKEISEKEIQRLMGSIEEKRKFYRIPGGNLVSLETPEYQALSSFIIDMGITTDTMEEVIRVPLIKGMQMIDSLEQSDLVEPGEKFAKLMKNLHNPENLELDSPISLEGVLRDYQKVGFRWFQLLAKYRFGGILADDMGLGKTLQSIAFIESVLSDARTRHLPILIVCPASLLYNWKNELEKFTPYIQAQVIDGNKTKRTELWKKDACVDVIITSYPTLRMDTELYRNRLFHTLFLDEAQAFKNPLTKTAKAVKMIQAEHRFALTGTPIENALDELWSIFHVVFPELLPGRRAFSELSRDSIAKRVRPFILRRMKQDVLKELPNKKETMLYSELQIEQKALYAAYLAELKQDALKHLKKGELQRNRIRILAGLTRLRQLCCHPALFVEGYKGSSAKFEQLMELLEECRISGRRVLIFSQFTQMLGIIRRQLIREGIPYFYLDGQTPSEERVTLCDRFNNGEGNLFLISLKAGGTGLNLNGADTVVLYDLWWNPAVEQQAADRAHRMGQENEVHIIRLIAKGTIEEKITQLQYKKKSLIDEVIYSGQDALSTMTEEDIKEILMIE